MTTQTNLQTYVFEQQEVRMIEKNNEPWFVVNDICNYFGVTNRSRLIQRLDKEEKGSTRMDTPGGVQNMTITNESGLYNLLFSLEPRQARGLDKQQIEEKYTKVTKFKRWVTSEVLPSIRKHGAYMNAETIEKALTDPDTIIRLATTLKEEREERMLLEQQIAEYEPKISYLDTILSSTDTVTITQIAADYGMSGQKLNKILNELNVQHKVGGQWILYRKHMQQGYTKSHTSEIPKADGGIKVVMNTKWSQKGRLFLYNLLKDEGYLPQMDLELED